MTREQIRQAPSLSEQNKQLNNLLKPDGVITQAWETLEDHRDPIKRAQKIIDGLVQRKGIIENWGRDRYQIELNSIDKSIEEFEVYKRIQNLIQLIEKVWQEPNLNNRRASEVAGKLRTRVSTIESYDNRYLLSFVDQINQEINKFENFSKQETVCTSADVYRSLSKYAEQYNVETHRARENGSAIVNRTYPGRLEDHNILLEGLFNPNNQHNQYQELNILKRILTPNRQQKFCFVDIGPGIANTDPWVERRNAKPAITSQEIADQFPEMSVVILDLPEEMDRFMGTDKIDSVISPQKKQEILLKENIHLIRGNGLNSILDQWKNPKTNPYAQKHRPSMTEKTTVVVRAANSIDIYCQWQEVKPAIDKMASDFFSQPVLLLFNREILVKEANSTHWYICGKISDLGFQHNSRSKDRKGKLPYELDLNVLQSISVNQDV